MIAIKNASICFPEVFNRENTLQSLIKNFFCKSVPQTKICSISQINLTLNSGDRLGVIGANGAGKTTLLRLLSGIYPPTNLSSSIVIEGRVSSLTDFTLGMEPEDNAWSNVVARLILMGIEKKKALQSVSEIIKFAGLESVASLPLRTYSTGMYLRLAFSICTHFSPDILIMDEVVGVGDESFRNSASARLKDIIHSSRILVLSSHDLSSIRLFCNRVIVLENGFIVFDGSVEDGISHYLNLI